MICSVLLLVALTSCVSGAIAVLSHQGQQNHNITLEWPFQVIVNRCPKHFTVYCEMFTDEKPMVLFHLHEGVRYPQDEHFAGRVHCDMDALRKGLVRLVLSGLRLDDAGEYNCQVVINTDVSFSELHLNVTAAEKDRIKPEEPEASRRRWIGLYVFLALLIAALLSVLSYLLIVHCKCRRKDEEKMMPSSQRGSVETFQSVA